MPMPKELPEVFILDCANRLGATSVPVEAIQRAWQKVVNRPYGWGCLNDDNGQRLFVAYRLREMGCFAVGCHEDDIRLSCELNCFDIYSDTKNLTDDEFDAFMRSRAKYRDNEARVAATKLWKLIDSYPVNALADRATYFRRDNQGTAENADR